MSFILILVSGFRLQRADYLCDDVFLLVALSCIRGVLLVPIETFASNRELPASIRFIVLGHQDRKPLCLPIHFLIPSQKTYPRFLYCVQWRISISLGSRQYWDKFSAIGLFGALQTIDIKAIQVLRILQ